MHERLHDHCPQGPVDTPARLEQGGEEAAVAELGNGQLHVAGLGRQHPGAAAVAVGGAGVVALVAGGADHLGRLQIDEGLQHELHRLTQEVEVAAGAKSIEKLGKGRLVEGHRGDLLRDPGKEHAEDPAVALLAGGPSTPPSNPTTPRGTHGDTSSPPAAPARRPPAVPCRPADGSPCGRSRAVHDAQASRHEGTRQVPLPRGPPGSAFSAITTVPRKQRGGRTRGQGRSSLAAGVRHHPGAR